MPQFYLRRWANADGMMHEYRRDSRTREPVCRLRYPRQSGFVEHLYSYESDDLISPDPDGLENALSDEESKAARVLQKMLAGEIGDLTRDEKSVWAAFMHLQLDRDPERVRLLLRVAEEARVEVLAAMPSGPAAERAASLFSVEVVRNSARGRLVSDHPARAAWVSGLTGWSWHSVTSPACFITTDRPVLLNARGAEPGEVAWTVAMALSPNLLLVATPSSWNSELDEAWFHLQAVTFNGRLLSAGPRFVYSAVPLECLPGMPIEALLAEDLVDFQQGA